jgi:hypothetical protein
MGNSFAILARRRKRAHVAGEIAQAERRLAKKRKVLATLDATLNLFEPTSNPELIPPIRPVSDRCLLFRHGEATRLCVSAMREADAPVLYRHVVVYALRAKGLDEADQLVRKKVAKLMQAILADLVRKGRVRKIISYPDTWWELA